ncbi:MAG: Fe-Mn family superoxide dismutase [bacterium]
MRTMTRIEPRVFPNLRQPMALSPFALAELERRYRIVVGKANEVLRLRATADRGTAHPVFSELRSIETALQPLLASAKAHSLMLAQLGGDSRAPRPLLAEQLARDFGGYDAFLAELGSCALASRGWVALVWDHDLARLRCVLGDEPERLSAWNDEPVLVFEVVDSTGSHEAGGDRRRLFATLLDSVDWDVAEDRLERAFRAHAVDRGS